MNKMRFYTTPSSIASYFGVGFNTPEEQLQIDLGYVQAEFDEYTQDRMELGKYLEDGVLNYFEYKLNIIIDERNDQLREFYNGKVKGKVDGVTILDGKKTVVENKVSNSKAHNFTDSLAYRFQVQSYMLDNDFEQALLCGIQEGIPRYVIIPRDEEMIADIKEMTDFIVDVLMGLDTFDNYPTHLLEKYSTTKILPNLDENIDDDLKEKIIKLALMKDNYKTLEKEIKDIENELKEKFDEGKFECITEDNKALKLTIDKRIKAGGFDMDKLSIEHPEIDYSKYRKPDTVYKVLKLTSKEVKNNDGSK